MTFEIASTNLVVELGVILALLIGWQFTLAEFVGGPIMIILVAVLFRLFLRQRLIEAARIQAGKGLAGSMEGHAGMDMTIGGDGSAWHRLRSPQAFTSISRIFVMEWAAVIRDIVIGLLIAGAVGAWVPDGFWRHLFLAGRPTLSQVWGPLIGPVVSLPNFVCSVGNVPLAAVLWNGGISFGGVVAFLFILAAFYVAMAATGYLTELLFGGLGLVPGERHAKVLEASIQWNYTTVLNIVFLALAATLLFRFVRSGGRPMLAMMGARIEELQQDLARAEERASRLVIAREEVTRVLGAPAAAEPPDGRPRGTATGVAHRGCDGAAVTGGAAVEAEAAGRAACKAGAVQGSGKSAPAV